MRVFNIYVLKEKREKRKPFRNAENPHCAQTPKKELSFYNFYLYVINVLYYNKVCCWKDKHGFQSCSNLSNLFSKCSTKQTISLSLWRNMLCQMPFLFPKTCPNQWRGSWLPKHLHVYFPRPQFEMWHALVWQNS